MGEPRRELPDDAAAREEAVDRVMGRTLRLVHQRDRALRRLQEVKGRRGVGGAVLTARNQDSLHGPGLVMALIALAEQARTSSPGDCLDLAEAAVDYAEELEDPKFQPLRARAWAEKGNAQRLLGEYAEARRSLEHALALVDRPAAGDPAYRGEVYSLVGSLEASLHRLDDALAWIDLALDHNRAEGLEIDRLLVQRAHLLIFKGDLPRALDDLVTALASLLERRERDPVQLLATCHNGLSTLLEISLKTSDTAERAHALLLLKAALPRLQPLYELVDAPLWRVRGHWQLGRLHLAEGRFDLARTLLDETVAAFLELGQNAAAAVAALELTFALARLREWGEMRSAAAAACVLFEAAGLRPDTWGALRALAECERAEAEAILADALQKAGGAWPRRAPDPSKP